jgi:hypothetical protein
VTYDGSSNKPPYPLNQNIKSDLSIQPRVNRNLIDYQYTIVQSISLVGEDYQVYQIYHDISRIKSLNLIGIVDEYQQKTDGL